MSDSQKNNLLEGFEEALVGCLNERLNAETKIDADRRVWIDGHLLEHTMEGNRFHYQFLKKVFDFYYLEGFDSLSSLSAEVCSTVGELLEEARES
ncbi:MAG: hypothetical protein MI784_00010 [Cytophagales bacterium]|nr:hypothetical protein [Cytophagales bacterium]